MSELPEQQLILLRGMPGAGKSTMAAWLKANLKGHIRTVEGDEWRGYGDSREYSTEFNSNAHVYALGMTANYLRFARSHVIVTNTLPTLAHIKPFFDLAKELNNRKVDQYNIKVTVMHVQGPLGRSVQAPPNKGCNSKRNIKAYLDSWQDYQGEFSA